MAEKLAMCQPNYSRLEKNNRACTKRLPQIADALGTTPEILKNYHLVKNEAGDLEAAEWVKELINEQKQTILQQKEIIRFQSLYIHYIYTTWQKLGIYVDTPLNEQPEHV